MALAAAAFAVPAASAGLSLGPVLGLVAGNCSSAGTQVFAAWSDGADYTLAPNGGLENGSTGWTLSGGAAVVSGNEPFYASGSHSLSLPSGSTATSPVICIGPNQIDVRMFGADAAGSDAGLHVRVIWYGVLNRVLGITDYDTFTPGSDWAPTNTLSTAGGLAVPLLPLLGSTSARVQLTPLGAGSSWQIDDLYVDPWLSRLG